jgi:2-polyprenyl-6-methoxyphenol hydroxylase-like FAD-dependent oxidoreductase
MTTRTSVLIAGAGPTGLTLAIELARRDLHVRIVDRANGPSRSSRGKGLQPRTLEVFEDLGVLDAVLESGGHYPRFRVHAGPMSLPFGRLGKIVEPTPSVPFPNLWMLPQWRTEEVLRARLEQLGCRPEFNASLTAFAQDEGGVSATIATPAGVEQVHADYLVGCDGGHSTVRKALDVRFEGEVLEAQSVVAADVEIDGLDRSYWHVWPLAKGCVLTLCPLPGTTQFQLAAPLRKGAAPPEMSEAGIRDFIEQRIGHDRVRVRRVSCTSLFRPQVRMVDRYRVGRVLLAGEAAHVHPPSGGQGLNTGVQDAYNLGWKLAHVVRGVGEGLLDTYEAERLPIAAGVLGLSKRLMVKSSTKRGAETKQLHLHYRGGPLTDDDVAKPGRVRAGDRAPDAPCVDASGTPRRLFEIFRGTHWTVLAFGEADLQAIFRERWSDVVRIVHVDGYARRVYGVGVGAALILVRPDGYIGYFGTPGSCDRLDQYLSHWVGDCVPKMQSETDASGVPKAMYQRA